jgi:hypothetical protein
MENPFEEIIRQLSTSVNIPLKADEHDRVALLVDEKLKVQLEMDKAQQKLIISGYISKVPPGKFRENVLFQALKANSRSYPEELGILGYSSYDNMLTLYDLIPLENLTGEKLTDLLALFVGKAMEWQSAIASGMPSPIDMEKPAKPFDFA